MVYKEKRFYTNGEAYVLDLDGKIFYVTKTIENQYQIYCENGPFFTVLPKNHPVLEKLKKNEMRMIFQKPIKVTQKIEDTIENSFWTERKPFGI